MENPWENFLSGVHKSHPPKLGGKLWGEKWTYGIFTQMQYGIKLKKKKKKEKKKKKQRESAREWVLHLLVLEAWNILEWERQSK